MKYCLQKIFAILLFAAFSTNGFAKPSEPYFDNILKNAPKDTQYIRNVEKYVWYLVNSLNNNEKADSLLASNEKLALKLKDYRGLVKIYFYQALILYRQAKNEESYKIYLKALQIVEKHKLPPNFRLRIIAGIAYYYSNKFDNENALKYALEAIELTEKYNLVEYCTPGYMIAADIYKQIDKAKSDDFYKKALEKSYQDSDSTQRYLAENYMSSFYLDRGDLKNALLHAQKSMFGVEKFGRKGSFVMAWVLLAGIYIDLKDAQKAKYYLEKSIKLAEEIKDYNRMADAYGLLGYYYYYLEHDLTKAETNYNICTELCKKMGNTYGVFLCYESLVILYEHKKDFKKALHFNKEARVLKDSLFSKDWALKLNRLEIEKKESNLKLLEEKNNNALFQRNLLILGALILFIMALGIIYLIVIRGKFKRFEEQQKLRNKLSADLHDEIGSSLSSISILSELVAYQQQKGNAKPEIMQQISNDARKVIDKMDDIIWAINPKNDSIQKLETRLKSFAIPLFESKGIDFTFTFPPDMEEFKIDSTARGDIYLILKEAINNLVKYSQCKNAAIDVENEDKTLIFSIKDNGIGFDVNAETQRNGLRNMKERAEKIGAKLIINSKIGRGTTIEIMMLK